MLRVLLKGDLIAKQRPAKRKKRPTVIKRRPTQVVCFSKQRLCCEFGACAAVGRCLVFVKSDRREKSVYEYKTPSDHKPTEDRPTDLVATLAIATAHSGKVLAVKPAKSWRAPKRSTAGWSWGGT